MSLSLLEFRNLNTLNYVANTVPARFSDLRFSDHKPGVFGRPIYEYHLVFSDLNGVDENWSLNPAGTVFSNCIRIKLFS